MNRFFVSVMAAGMALFMVACDTPSDYRPGAKVSTDLVPPGGRRTFNVGDAGGEAGQPGTIRDEVLPNHDPGVNRLDSATQVPEEALTNDADSMRFR